MKPFDPRLLKYAAAARAYLVTEVPLMVLHTVGVIVFCWLLSDIVVDLISGASLASQGGRLLLLGSVAVLRSVVGWGSETNSASAAGRVKSQLRRRLAGAVGELGPGWLAGRNRTDVVTLAGAGLESLDDYFSLYLPQLIRTVVATPLIVAAMFWGDPLCAVIVIATLPLIPVFMILIGMSTRSAQQTQWKSLERLSREFVDVVNGLSTLVIFGRARRQTDRIARITEEYRVRTMKVLRMSFLSGFTLDLAATLSVALIAVTIGIRLIAGDMAFSAGLFVLLLAPEAFLPIRQVGVNYHAAANGLAAAQGVFEVLEHPPVARHQAPQLRERAGRSDSLELEDVSIAYGDRRVVSNFTASLPRGELVALTGTSGSGKSSLVAAILGFIPFTGRISLGTRTSDLRSSTAWAGQRPGLIEGTLRDNVALGVAEPSEALVHRALTLVGLSDLRPDVRVTTTGTGLSGGQAQRVAIARAIYRCVERDCDLLVVDEPSAALDPAAESLLVDGLREIAGEGRIVVVISHRQAIAAGASRVVAMKEPHHELV